MKRRQAREVAIQSLFVMEVNDMDVHKAISEVLEQMTSEADEGSFAEADEQSMDFIYSLVKGTADRKDEIDALLIGYLQGWKKDRLSKVDLQVLRMAAFELLHAKDTPPKAVVNEAIELAKHFGEEESGKFVNGVLGRVLREKKLDGDSSNSQN